MVQCVSILGSTGSIGRQSLDIIRRLPGIQVAALTAGTNVDRMAQQCREFSPKLAVMATQEAAQALAERIKGLSIRVNFGEAGLMEAASMADADCVITAVVGMVGLKPTLAAIRAKKRIGLANKETLVCAGELVMAEAETVRCGDRPRGFRAFRNLSMPYGLWQQKRDPAADPHLLRRPIFRHDPPSAGNGDQSRRPEAPQLENGREDHR